MRTCRSPASSISDMRRTASIVARVSAAHLVEERALIS